MNYIGLGRMLYDALEAAISLWLLDLHF